MNALSPTIMLPLLWRRARVKASGIDQIDRYAEVAVDNSITRQRLGDAGEFDEDLVVGTAAIRMTTIDRAGPPSSHHEGLADFWPFGLEVTKRANFAVRLSLDPAHRRTADQILEGKRADIWFAYLVHRVEIEDRPGDVPLYRVSNWEPLEIAASPRRDAATYPANITRIAPPEKELEMDPTIRTRAIAALANKGLPPTPSMIETITRAEASAARQRATAIVDEAMARVKGDNRVIGPANAEARAAAITSALLHRHDPDKHPLSAGGENFRGMSLLAIARDSLEVAGIRTDGMDRVDLAKSALAGATRAGGLGTTSDFSSILSNIANKTLRDAYEAAPQTFRPIVRETSVTNFKPVARDQVSEAPKLEKIGEHGEYHRGALGEAREQYAIATYGRIVGITRDVIINDDVDAFTRIPAMFGTQAANLESDLVWAQILGPRPMGDGLPVFHATHKNIGVPIALGEIGLGGGRAAMRKQTGLDGRTFLHIAARYLIVPAALETTAEQLTAMITPTRADDVVPQAIRSLQAVTEARLDLGFTDPHSGDYIAPSATAWYMATSPGAIDTVELAYLEGNRGVYTQIRNGFDVDGIEIKVRLDVGAKVIDWRGFYRNAGAPA